MLKKRTASPCEGLVQSGLDVCIVANDAIGNVSEL